MMVQDCLYESGTGYLTPQNEFGVLSSLCSNLTTASAEWGRSPSRCPDDVLARLYSIGCHRPLVPETSTSNRRYRYLGKQETWLQGIFKLCGSAARITREISRQVHAAMRSTS